MLIKNVELRETLSYTQAGMITSLEESEKNPGKKNLFMEGVFITGETRNHNERIYPLSEITKAVDSINKELISGYSVLGEIDHPTELNINLDRVSHSIIKMWMSGNNGMGKLRILETPSGQIIRTLIESDVKLGVSSRGMGNVDDRGIVSDYTIVCVDIVAKPSANAYPKPVYEMFNMNRGNIIHDLATVVKYDKKAQKYLTEEVLNIIKNLK